MKFKKRCGGEFELITVEFVIETQEEFDELKKDVEQLGTAFEHTSAFNKLYHFLKGVLGAK